MANELTERLAKLAFDHDAKADGYDAAAKAAVDWYERTLAESSAAAHRNLANYNRDLIAGLNA